MNQAKEARDSLGIGPLQTKKLDFPARRFSGAQGDVWVASTSTSSPQRNGPESNGSQCDGLPYKRHPDREASVKIHTCDEFLERSLKKIRREIP